MTEKNWPHDAAVVVGVVSLRPDLPTLLLHRVQELARLDSVGRHRLVGDPTRADMVLFTDLNLVPWHVRQLLDHPLRHRFYERSLVYSEADRPWCAAPGVYVSMPASAFVPEWQRAGMYLTLPSEIVDARRSKQPDLLFSFVGARTHPCRRAIFELSDVRSLVIDSTGFVFFDSAHDAFEANRQRFRDTVVRSKFVLCPRGHGTSSFRLVETLAVGRVPVIVSDEWVPPTGIAWDTCSLRIDERDIATVGMLLRERECDWPELSEAARDVYQNHFAPDVAFNRLIEDCLDVARSSDLAQFPRRGVRDARWARIALSNAMGRVRTNRT